LRILHGIRLCRQVGGVPGQCPATTQVV